MKLLALLALNKYVYARTYPTHVRPPPHARTTHTSTHSLTHTHTHTHTHTFKGPGIQDDFSHEFHVRNQVFFHPVAYTELGKNDLSPLDISPLHVYINFIICDFLIF